MAQISQIPPRMADIRPREEQDLSELYPDLDAQKQLPVFINDNYDHGEEIPVPNGPMPVDLQQLKIPNFSLIETGPHTTVSKQPPSITYIRPNFELKKRRPEYDMDEQDLLYLEHRNGKSENTVKLKPEIFEILVSELENQWQKLELQMSSLANEEENGVLSVNLDKTSHQYGHDDGIVMGSLDDQKCAVCNESDCDNSNAIVFCDGCNIAVHQECYGVAFIPEGLWYCRKCMINKNRQVDCCFCPSKTGAFKQLDNSLWSHVICGLWINELYFANPIYMEPIEGIDMVPKSRWKLNCYICKQKGGACIQCYNRNCFQAYHVTCGKRAQLCMKMTNGVQGAVKNKTTLRSFCDRHTPSDYILSQDDIIEGINKTRVYFRDLKLLNLQNDRLNRDKQLNNKLNMFKWKTEANTPIAPQLFSNILYDKLLLLKVGEERGPGILKGLGNIPRRTKQMYHEELESISNDICRYWCLKRESKNGAPLIRKTNRELTSGSLILYGNNSVEEIDQKIDFAKLLLDDLNRLISLSEFNLDRQQINHDIIDIDYQLIQGLIYPISKFIDIVLNGMLRKYDSKHSLSKWKNHDGFGIETILQTNGNFQIKTVAELQNLLTQLDALIIHETKPNHTVFKVWKNLYAKFKERIDEYIAIESSLSKLPMPINIESSVQLVKELDSDLSDVEEIDYLDDFLHSTS